MFKIQPGNQYYYIHNDWAFLSMHGSDSKDFLHRMTTFDYRRIQPGQVCSNLFLQPTGKLIAFFNTLVINAQEFLLFYPLSQFNTTQNQNRLFDELEKFHFTENFQIVQPIENWNYIRTFAHTKPNVPPEVTVFQETDFNDSTQNVFIESWGLLFPDRLKNIVIQNLEQQNFQRLESIQPIMNYFSNPVSPTEIHEGILPLDIGLDFMIAENKGCYPGQEVIERIRSMGSPPKILVKIQSIPNAALTNQVPPSQSKILKSDGTEAGTLTSSSVHPLDHSCWIGLGILGKTQLDENEHYQILNQSVVIKKVKK